MLAPRSRASDRAGPAVTARCVLPVPATPGSVPGTGRPGRSRRAEGLAGLRRRPAP